MEKAFWRQTIIYNHVCNCLSPLLLLNACLCQCSRWDVPHQRPDEHKIEDIFTWYPHFERELSGTAGQVSYLIQDYCIITWTTDPDVRVGSSNMWPGCWGHNHCSCLSFSSIDFHQAVICTSIGACVYLRDWDDSASGQQRVQDVLCWVDLHGCILIT